MRSSNAQQFLGGALAVLGALVAVLAFAPSVLGDCVLWCFFGRGTESLAAGAVGVVLIAAGLVVLLRAARRAA